MAKGTRAPQQPDFTNVINNINTQSNELAGWGRSAWDWATGALKSLEPYVQGTQQLASDQATKSAQAADLQRSGYSRYLPVMSKQIDTAMNYDSPENIARWRALSTAQIAKEAQAAGDSAKANLVSYGVKPTDARFGALDFGLKMQQAATTAAQNNAIRLGVEQQGANLRQGVINTGLQEAGLANQTTGTAASTGVLPVTAGTSYLGAASPYMNPLGYSTAALGGYGQTGNIYNQAYGNQMAQWQAQQNAGGSGLGTALGIGSMLATPFFPAAGMVGMGASRFFEKGGVVDIEGGRRPGQDYNVVHADRSPRGQGHMQQPYANPGPGGPAAYPRTDGMYGPGTYQEPKRDWKFYYADGGMVGSGALPIAQTGGMVPPGMSPSGGAVVDDIPAVVNPGRGGPPRVAAINDGEFIFPREAVMKIGSDRLQSMVDKALGQGQRDQPVNAGRRPATPPGGGRGVLPFAQAA